MPSEVRTYTSAAAAATSMCTLSLHNTTQLERPIWFVMVADQFHPRQGQHPALQRRRQFVVQPRTFDDDNGALARARAPEEDAHLLTATKDIDISEAAVLAGLVLS